LCQNSRIDFLFFPVDKKTILDERKRERQKRRAAKTQKKKPGKLAPIPKRASPKKKPAAMRTPRNTGSGEVVEHILSNGQDSLFIAYIMYYFRL
jgi:hypothetical protein